MKVYVAAHCRWAACHVSDVLRAAGHTTTSSWTDQPFNPQETHTELERAEIAAQDVSDVLAADALVLVAGPGMYSGGKFVEAGIALGADKLVVIIGRRENMLLWHLGIYRVDTPADAAALLSEAAA